MLGLYWLSLAGVYSSSIGGTPPGGNLNIVSCSFDLGSGGGKDRGDCVPKFIWESLGDKPQAPTMLDWLGPGELVPFEDPS